nr:hypothetical protein [Tanacetum cinerariifolium]
MIITFDFLSFIFDEWGCVGLPRCFVVLWGGVLKGVAFVYLGVQAMENQCEVYNGLLVAKDAKREEESKLVALNDLIAKALDDIDTLETDVEILDGDDNGV